MQIIAFLLMVVTIYAMFDTTQIELTQAFEDQADVFAKQLEYYHAQAVSFYNTSCASPGSGPGPGPGPGPGIGASCGPGLISMFFAQLANPQLLQGAWSADVYFPSYTDGTYMVTVWQAPSGMLAADPAHLYGTVAAILKQDSHSSFSVGAYDAATGVVGGGLYMSYNGTSVTQSVAIVSPFAGLNIPAGAPVLVTPLQ